MPVFVVEDDVEVPAEDVDVTRQPADDEYDDEREHNLPPTNNETAPIAGLTPGKSMKGQFTLY